MNQWPPSPSVEDETTALANEHSLNGAIESLKSDDQGATIRGAVDQYPILINTADLEAVKEADIFKKTRKLQCTSDISSSDDSAGPSTPPPPFRKPDKYHYAQTKVQSGASPRQAATPPSTNTQASSRARPQVTRIQTDVSRDARPTAACPRRPPSPHSLSRASTFDGGARHGNAIPVPTMLSPQQAAAVNLHRSSGTQQSFSATGSRGIDQQRGQLDHRSAATDHIRLQSERADERPSARNVPVFRYDAQSQSDGRASRNNSYTSNHPSYYEIPARTSQESPRYTPSSSRRHSRESTQGVGGEDVSARYRPTHARTSTRDVYDAPFTSSTDESSRGYGRRSRRGSDEGRRSRRRSSNRTERPTLVDMSRGLRPESVPASAIEPPRQTQYCFDPRNSGQFQSPLPMTADANKAEVEDYFAKAFKENDNRKLQYKAGLRPSGSALVSPMMTPPRSPRLEQHQRSRPPSMDEEQMRNWRRSSLLPGAGTGASHGTGVAGIPTKSPAPWIDASIAVSTSKGASAPRSRRSSPVSEVVNNYGQSIPSRSTDPIITRPSRTSTYEAPRRSYASTTEPGNSNHNSQLPFHSPAVPQPSRVPSYTSPEQSQLRKGSFPPSVYGPINPATATGPTEGRPNPPQNARSSVNTVDAVAPVRVPFTLPVCPRSQPTVGLNGWYTLKELPDVDVCDSCIGAIRDTRYRDLFVPSLPRPYNEPSVCIMSKPWIRIAFMQSLRQNKSNLDKIRKMINLPKAAKPCAGDEKDIRKWYHVLDPQTKQPVPDFLACEACVDAVDICFPEVGVVFRRPKHGLIQESRCSMHAGNKHFDSIIDRLEQAEIRCRGRDWRSGDIEPLVRHMDRVARYQPCPRDEMQSSRAWHFSPDLLEFTVCEECYDDVVRPLQDRFVARDISRGLRMVPRRRGSDGASGISCQLYSDKMRQVFRDAVATRDSKLLYEAVHARVTMQQRLNDMNNLYEQDIRFGVDRRGDIERNREIWRSIE